MIKNEANRGGRFINESRSLFSTKVFSFTPLIVRQWLKIWSCCNMWWQRNWTAEAIIPPTRCYYCCCRTNQRRNRIYQSRRAGQVQIGALVRGSLWLNPHVGKAVDAALLIQPTLYIDVSFAQWVDNSSFLKNESKWKRSSFTHLRKSMTTSHRSRPPEQSLLTPGKGFQSFPQGGQS